jgi:pyruvate,water dikinase
MERRRSMSLTVFFDQPEATLPAVSGGKGSNLAALTAAGFPVPAGFVVTAAAYERFLDSVAWLDGELAALAFAQAEVLRGQCARLQKRLTKVELPPPVAEAIRAALSRLDVTDADPVAVRSSSTFEDLAQAAFAGQHDTYLNIRGVDAVIRSVRDCYVSLWSDRAVLYRQHQGFAQREARMAVVVQQQIACDMAGVAFSIDPVSGRTDRLVIDANYGLGESVVAGECEVDHYELDKATLKLVACKLGHKDQMIVATPAGIEKRPVPPELADQPCLKDDQIRPIGELLLRVESHYGWPQDIEWGWKDGALYQFQSRPVTTTRPRWTRDLTAERFPNPLTPLTWDLIRVAFQGSLDYSMALMGLPALKGEWFQVVDHYVYANQNAAALVAVHRPLRAKNLQELLADIPRLRRRYGWVLDLPVRWARDLDRYLLRLGRLSALDVEGLDAATIWRHMTQLLEVAGEYFRPNMAITITQAFLHRLLHGLVNMVVGPEKALAIVDGLLAGCETKTAVVNRELHELAQLAAQTPALQRQLLDRDGEAFWESGAIQAFPDFAARFQRFVDDHGHREMDMDFYHPTWSDRPGIVIDSMRLILAGDPGDDSAENARRQRQRFAATELQFLAGLPEEARFFFRELIRLARTYTTLDDLEHYQTTRLNPVARRLALALGRRLQERGILNEPEDVFFFQRADLERAVAGGDPAATGPLRQKVFAAKASYEASRRQAPPWSLEEVDRKADADRLDAYQGLPGSPGRVTGRCFRVSDPADFARFPQGAILVARTTNPAWTPLFYSAAGLITESGGPLSHGAVTAREMQLPAVMAIRGAMTLFSDGQMVTVDGSQGKVWSEPG